MMERLAKHRLPSLLAAGLLALLTNCAAPPLGLAPPPSGPEPDPAVTLSAGDQVEIKFYYTPDLNETQTVRPDGRINLQLIGAIQVQGLTPVALEKKLASLYTPHLKRPQATVIIRQLVGRRIYVGGQVTRPGLIAFPGTKTALEAIMEAGGFDLEQAEPANVLVLRLKEKTRQVYALNLAKALSGEGSAPFYLKPSDVIFVPRSRIAKLDQWVEQYINKIIPDISFTRSLGNSSYGIETFRRN